MSERTICRICQAYCGLDVEIVDGRVGSVRADRDHPISRGYTCSKGRALGDIHHHRDRLLAHRVHGAEATAVQLLDDLAARLVAIRDEHGPDAIAVYRGTAAYFDSAALIALGGFISGLGTRSLYTTSTIDQVARFWVAELMCGHFGIHPLVDQTDPGCTILVGTNPPASHGHVGSWPDPVVRLRSLAERGDLWCIDVRRTETAAIAGHHLVPRAGTDWAVLGHVVRELLASGADAAFIAETTIGVDDLAAAVAPLDRTTASTLSGVDAGDLDELVAAVRRAGRVAVNTGTGTTMGPFGDVTEWMAWALMGVTGSFDRPGGVWFNPGILRPRRSPGVVLDEPGPPSRPGLRGRFGERPTAALVDEIEAGNVRALLVAGGNPLRAVPGTARLAAAFDRLEVLAVADVLEGPTVAAATHVFACAAQFERADVALVESMYPVPASQYTPALMPTAGDTRPAFDLWTGLAERLGSPLVASSPEGVVDHLAGAHADTLRRDRIVLGEPEFGWFADAVLPEGRWRLAPAPLVGRLAAALAAPPMPADTLLLTPRRQLGHMNTLLAGTRDTPDLLMAPVDATRLGLGDGTPVHITSPSGAVTAQLRIDPGMGAGTVSLPHGFADPDIGELVTDTTTVHPDYGMPVLAAVPVTAAGAPVT